MTDQPQAHQNQDGLEPPETGRRSMLSPRARVLLFTAALSAFGCGLLVVTPLATVEPQRPWAVPFWLLALAFAVTESVALHVEIRKESHSLSLSSIPFMVGLLYTSPTLLGAAYIVGGGAALLVVRRSGPLKTAWNASLFLAQSALAGLIVRSTLGMRFPANGLDWLAPLGAVLAVELVSLLAVPLVIMAVDVKFRPNLFGTLGQSQILAALAGVNTVAVLAAASQNASMLAYGLIPVVGVGVLLRVHGRLAQNYRDLQQLQRFTRALANERSTRTVETGLVELVGIMRARSAGLLAGASGADPATLCTLVDDVPTQQEVDRIPELVAHVLGDAAVVHITSDDPRPAARELLSVLDAIELIGVPVLREVDRDGMLFVTDRLGATHRFNGEEIGLFGSLADTFDGRLINDYLVAELETQAQIDALTGLANRLTFETSLAVSLASPRGSGFVVMIDLDRFKEVNDSLGHETGDQLLIEIGRRLRSSARSDDLVARLGGDEFALLFRHRPNAPNDSIDQRLAELQDRLTQPVEIDGLTFEIGASIGVAEWPTDGNDSDVLLRRADAAMYHAKRRQLGIVRYSPKFDSNSSRHLELSLAVRNALNNGDLEVHFQPKVSLVDGTITGAEALARWTHPTHGTVAPDEFIPLLTRAGLTGQLTRYVLRHAAEFAARLADRGMAIDIAVNLTPRDLLDASLPDDTASILHDLALSPLRLLYEITEDAMVVDFDASASVLNRLRQLGVRIAVDDFGTGYSSLQYLNRLPIDQIKIDRAFVARAHDDSGARAIIEISLILADRLGLTTVAEGIEDHQTLDIITNLGCDEIQGFLLSRALPPEAFEQFAQDWRPDDIANCTVDSATPAIA